MPKFCKNDAKMEVEITDLSYLALEAKIARNYCIYNIFLGFGHVKSDEISGIFDAKSMPENVMQKAIKIMSNGYQNEVRIMYNSIKIRKKGWREDCKNW